MRLVSLTVLGNRLSEYVRLAAGGETVLVTDRDRVVAELVPPRVDQNMGLAGAIPAEAVRVAVPLEPGELDLVGIEVLHPQLGGVRVRREGADRLDIDAGDDAGLRHHDVDLRVALEGVAVAEGEIVPADNDRRRALRQ